jgi:two-component sensor histidine kinase
LSSQTRDLREKLLIVLLRVIAAGSLVALVPSAYLALRERLWVVLVGDLFSSILIAIMALVPTIPYRAKLFTLIGLSYALGLLLLVETGLFGAGHLYIFAFVFLVALFGGRIAMLLANSLAILTHVALALAKAAGILPWEQNLSSVIVISANFILVSIALSFSAHYLVNGFARAAIEEGRMRAALETMIQEIEHRVKNNLQVISSLVNLKTRTGGDPAQAIEDIKTSLSAISAVHRILYRREAFYLVKIRTLVETLVERYRQLYGGIDFRVSWLGEEAEMDSERAVNLGLLVNEIVTNSLKYAFPEGGRGRIFVELVYEAKSRELRMRIGDEGGAEAPKELGGASGGGMGLKIVEAIARQLGATMVLESDDAWTYNLRMKIAAPAADLLPETESETGAWRRA